MTKHSHKPPPMPLLNFTLRAMAQEKPPHAHTRGRHTPPQKTSLFLLLKLRAVYEPATGLNHRGQMTSESSNLFMNEVRTGGVIAPCFQVANTRLSMALFVTLKSNMSISIYESPSL